MAILDRIFKQDFRLSKGTANLISQSDNVLSAIEHRFSVFAKSIPFRPAYGGNLKRYSNEPMTKELQNKIVKEVQNQIGREKRVKAVRKISIDNKDSGEIVVNVEVIMLGNTDSQQFQVVI